MTLRVDLRTSVKCFLHLPDHMVIVLCDFALFTLPWSFIIRRNKSHYSIKSCYLPPKFLQIVGKNLPADLKQESLSFEGVPIDPVAVMHWPSDAKGAVMAKKISECINYCFWSHTLSAYWFTLKNTIPYHPYENLIQNRLTSMCSIPGTTWYWRVLRLHAQSHTDGNTKYFC